MPRLPRHGKIIKKYGKYGSLGRKNFFPGQGEKIIENILKIFGKIFGSMKNIYYLCSVELKEQARSTGEETGKIKKIKN